MDRLLTVSIFLCLLAFSSCQKAVIEEASEEKEQEDVRNVIFNIQQFEQVSFSQSVETRSQDIKDLCSHVCLAIYSGSERIKSETQKSSDSDFGTFSLKLAEGSYRAMIVAHNQSKNPSTTNPEKVQFDNDLTDVLFWSKEITVGENSTQSIDVDMHRQAAMVRFVTTDSVPENISRLDFYYTGGSAALNATTGLGSVNSKQTAKRSITNDMTGKTATFEIYTIPKTESGSTLKIQITGYNSSDVEVFKRTFDEVPVKKNMVTIYKGKLFTDTGSSAKEGEAQLTLTTNDEWQTTLTEY